MENQWLKKGPCPECGSSDAKVRHVDGHSYCFSCNTRFKSEDNMNSQTKKIIPMHTEQNKPDYNSFKIKGEFGRIDDRNIKEETARKYNTLIKKDGSIITHHI